MTLALSNQIMAQVFMTFPFLEADGLSTEQLFKPVHPIAPDSPETFSPPSEGIYDLEAFFEFEAATQADIVEDQPVLGAGSTAINICSDFPVTTHGFPPVEPAAFLTWIRAGADDALETYSPTYLAEPLSSTKSDSLQAMAIGPPAISHANTGHCIPDTSSGKNAWKVDGKAVGYGNAGGNASPRSAGAVQAAPEADDTTLYDLEPNNANPIQSVPVGLNRASETGKSPSLKGRKSRLQPVEKRKTIKDSNVRRPDARATRRKHHAIARLDSVFFRQFDNIQARSYKWPKRADRWKVEPPIYDFDLMSLFWMHPGALVIYVRPGFGDLIRIEWDEGRQKFVCADVPGRRLYLVSVKEIEHLLSNPEQGVKLKYWRYY
ncbi:hypothetical protein F5B17DRAFT_419569 [Nemania serpens]|nr:hypothetical protein F5B17DRAFT_419569 [Nemania serpens]